MASVHSGLSELLFATISEFYLCGMHHAEFKLFYT
jgi:hypothetical protein